jgi:hypothetical protein
MDSNETPKLIFDITAVASTLAMMEAWHAALEDAIPKMRALVSLSGALIPEGAVSGFSQSATLIAPGEVPPGSFHGLSIPAAAVLYLRMVKQKQKASEIARALLRGGIQTTASNFNNQVHAALDRASKKENAEIFKMHGAYWALREWLSASVRASMGSGPTAKGKKGKHPKKRKASAPVTIEAKFDFSKPKPKPKPRSKTNGAAQGESIAYKAPEPDSTEGRILAAMRRLAPADWSAADIAKEANIPRVQTAHFLLGKLAFRGLVKKTEAGAFRIP